MELYLQVKQRMWDIMEHCLKTFYMPELMLEYAYSGCGRFYSFGMLFLFRLNDRYSVHIETQSVLLATLDLIRYILH